MSTHLIFDDAEIIDPADLTAIGTNAKATSDALMGGALGWPAHHARFTVSSPAADTVRVSAGEYHDSPFVFTIAAPIDVSLQSFKPILGSDERWMALILRGTTETLNATRAFETSEEPLTTSIPVNMSTPKYEVRSASIILQAGAIAPAPAFKPTINEGDCCLAFVRLTTSGVVEIVPNDFGRVKTVFEIEGRLTVVEVRVEKLFQETASIATDLAALAARFKNYPSRLLFDQLTNDVARTRQQLNFPAAARNYFFDGALVRDFWDFTHVSSIFRIKEGIRFAYAQQRDAQLRLLNEADSNINFYDNRIVLPAYDEVLKIESPVGALRQDISNTVHTVVTAVQHTVSHTSIRYGETINVCENTAGWGAIADRRPGEIFAVNGQEFVSGGATNNPWNQTETAQNGHTEFAAQRIIVDSYSETYTTYNTELFGLNGAIFAQTFLVSQMMVLTSIEINFTRVGPTGDVIMCLCEVDGTGAPDFKKLIATTTVEQADLDLGWTKFPFDPTLLEQGRRYGWFTVTTGNHQLAVNTGNTFAGGTKFQCTDGVYAQGNTTDDFSFRLNAAKFRRNRTVVQLESATLENGMTELTMVFQGWQAPGTRLAFEVKTEGTGDWVLMDARAPNPLANLPALTQIRAVFEGTEDLAPAMILTTDARILTGRHRTDMVAVSKVLTFGYTTDEIQIVLNMDAYDSVHHTAIPKIIKPDNTVVSPSSTVAEVDRSKPSRTKITANFNAGAIGAAIGSCRIRLDATTDSTILVPFGQDIQLNAY